MRTFFLLLIAGLLLLALSCSEPSHATPKPRAFPKVDYPERGYQSFDEGYCPLTFEYPLYAEVQRDTAFFEEAPPHPCWFDLYFPDFDGRLHCSYAPIGGEQSWERLKDDAFSLADWHNKKANYIDELRVDKGNGVSGMVFLIEGAAASPFQFYLTDSTRHFIRGAFYFNTEMRPDSMAPIYSFVQQDLLRLIETFEWAE